MSDRFVVIGSNSFSGASFVAHLLGKGAEVIGISRSQEADPVFLPYRWGDCAAQASERFQFHALDLNNDLDRIDEVIRDAEAPYVVNFAAQGMVAESWIWPGQWYQTNVVANVSLHDRLRKMPFLKKYLHVGTPEVYGHTEGKIDETAPFNPSTPYATSRAACDMSLRNFLTEYEFPVVWTRAANVYGPGQQLYRIIPRTILAIRLGQKLPLHGGGHSVRSFIHIRDVAEATERAALQGKPGETFHLSTDRFVSIRELVEIICDKMGADFNEVVEVTGERPGKDHAYRLGWEKARGELGWEPVIALDQGIEETVGWVEDNLAVLEKLPLEYQHKA